MRSIRISLFSPDHRFQELLEAIESDDLQAAQDAIARGAPTSGRACLKNAKRAGTDLPVVEAIRVDGDGSMLRLLSEAGADMSQPGVTGLTALMIAAKQGDLDSLTTLISLGAVIDGNPKTAGALALACFYGEEQAVELLLAKGANPQAVLSRDMTSLMRIPGSILRLLVEAGGEAPEAISEMLSQRRALGD